MLTQEDADSSNAKVMSQGNSVDAPILKCDVPIQQNWK